MRMDEKTMRETNGAYDYPVWVKGPHGNDFSEIQAIGESKSRTCVHVLKEEI